MRTLVDGLIPAAPEGPGVLESGVHEFIDLQMNMPYAYGALWYMQAPFVVAPEQFGYQFHMNPREMYRSALVGLTMAPYAALLNDEQVAQVVTYIQASWSNTGGVAKAAQVAKIRKISVPVKAVTEASFAPGRSGTFAAKP
ncbi:hypothetical protein HNR39_001460 [Glaciimonas immobilis]|uniref:Uncharacterized protein n=1 Tax=Glaciimonas immobilis TaxID=728004 RepID=A0A840RRL8_9BURK|nr:gluconate 2-dehydrogenase subunit 3 family protein [Glaciimonas immobilis]MBB5199628.1 hypothetical protein [Glaciimonas immobilis]